MLEKDTSNGVALVQLVGIVLVIFGYQSVLEAKKFFSCLVLRSRLKAPLPETLNGV